MECGAPAKPALGFACVDEAHCLSEWSHNFRPSYMAVGRTLQERLGVTTFLGLTATATARTAQSICTCLDLPGDALQRHDIQRPNLSYSAEIVPSSRRSTRVRELLGTCMPKGGAAIIYCSTRWEVDGLSRELQSRGWKCDGYHAGRMPHERQKVQADFMSGQLQVVVATIAFGLGVNKSNVRLIVHVGVSRSIEAWVQETGRAGRDNNLAKNASRSYVRRTTDGSTRSAIRTVSSLSSSVRCSPLYCATHGMGTASCRTSSWRRSWI